jgi:hypothetical protein
MLAGPLAFWEGVYWSALVSSPSVMLGVNRGNVDMLLFALLMVALMGLARASGRARAFGCAVIKLAAFLKLSPIFASAAVLQWRRRRPALLAFSALLIVFGVYALVIRHEIETIRSVIPAGIDLSFGAGVIVGGLRAHFGHSAFLIRDRPFAVALIALFTLAIGVALAIASGRRQREEPESSTRLLWLWAGGAVFIGCSAFTENGFDYRLAFCLLAVPQLLQWARQDRPAVPLPTVGLVLLLLGLWLSDTQPFLWHAIDYRWVRAESVFPFDELLVWGLVVYFTVALVRTLPIWLPRLTSARAPSPVTEQQALG